MSHLLAQSSHTSTKPVIILVLACHLGGPFLFQRAEKENSSGSGMKQLTDLGSACDVL